MAFGIHQLENRDWVFKGAVTVQGDFSFGNAATDDLTVSGDLVIIDDRFLHFGTDEDVSIEYDEDGTNTLLVTGAAWAITPAVTITGLATLNGGVTAGGALIQGGTGAITSTSGAGAVAITGQVHEVTTTGTGDALTLANGTAGQRLCVIYVAEGAGGDTAIITPTTLAGGSTITLNDLGDSCDLIYSATGGWYVLGLGGAAAVA